MVRNFAVKAVHKQMYPATYTFRDEADGTSGTDIDGIDTETATDTGYNIQVIASEDGHKKVLKAITNGDNGTYALWYDSFTPQTDGTIEFWIKYIDKGVGNYYFYWEGDAIYFGFNSTTNTFIYYYGDGVGGTTSGNTATTSDTWYHIKCSFDCATDTHSLWLNGTILYTDENFTLDRTRTDIDYCRLQLSGAGGANSLECYWSVL